MLLNLHVSQPTANAKVVQKMSSFCLKRWSAVQHLSTGQQADINIKVKNFHQWWSGDY